MEIISQEEAKLKIKGWFSQGLTEIQVRENLANYGFLDVVINLLINEVHPPVKPILSPPPVAEFDPKAEVIIEIKPEPIKLKNIKWYEWLTILPTFYLIYKGGVYGGIVGLLGWRICLNVIRNPIRSKLFRFYIILCLTIVYFLFYFVSIAFFLKFLKMIWS